MGWGTGLWGVCPHGICTPAGPGVDLGILAVDVVASDMISVFFNKDAKNNIDLSNPANYSIVPIGGGQPVNVRSVQSGNEIRAGFLTLYVTPFTVGEEYTVTASNLRAADGSSLSITDNSAVFKGRITKTDSAIRYRESIFGRDPESLIRNIMTALSLEDDLIGGSRR